MTQPASSRPASESSLRPAEPAGAGLPDGSQLDTVRRGILLIAMRALGDRDAAEDVAQEAIARLLTALSRQAAPVRDLGAFARGIARHVISDAHERRRRHATLDAAHDSVPDARAEDPLVALVRTEQVARVRECVARLAPDDRALLDALYVEGLTPAAIATRAGEPQERIRKRKSRLLRRLRGLFQGHDSAAQPTDDGEAP